LLFAQPGHPEAEPACQHVAHTYLLVGIGFAAKKMSCVPTCQGEWGALAHNSAKRGSPDSIGLLPPMELG